MPQAPSLRQLRAFRHVMSLGGMSAAAEALNLTQPALSKQIALMEETLGFRLFVRRRGGPIAPTQEGLAFFKSIEGTLYGIDAIPDIARDISSRLRTQLRIAGTPPVLNAKAFTGALAAFRARAPDVQVSIIARQRVDLEDWVRNRQADISFGLLPSRYPDLASISLSEVGAVAVLSPTHPLADRDHIEVRDSRGNDNDPTQPSATARPDRCCLSRAEL